MSGGVGPIDAGDEIVGCDPGIHFLRKVDLPAGGAIPQILHLILANPVIMSISRTYTFTSLDPRCAPDARKNEVAATPHSTSPFQRWWGTPEVYREVH